MRSTSVLRSQHASLQYSDTRKQQRRDISDLFSRAKGFPLKTFTEAGPEVGNDNREFLLEFAKQYDHVIHFARSNAIAIDRRIIQPKTVRKTEKLILRAGEVPGPGHDTVLGAIRFRHVDPRIGVVSQGVIHVPTKGRYKGERNFANNDKVAEQCAEWMKNAGAGTAIALLNGDFNQPDDKLDWARGRDFTSIADELKAWRNTGHGPIDGMCSYDLDARVKGKRFWVLNDKAFFQHSDHFVCRCAWTIGHLRIK